MSIKILVKKETRGGARPGAGQPRKEPTKTISVRVPLKHYDTLKEMILKITAEYLRMNKILIAFLILAFSCTKNSDTPIDQPALRINVKDYGAKGDSTTDDNAAITAAMMAAHQKQLPLYFPAGKYNARIQLSFDSLQIIGEARPGSSWTNGTIILGLVDCNYKKNTTIQDLGIDSRNRLLPGDDAALTSGQQAGDQPLVQTFRNIALIGGGFNDFKHGILCQAGSDIRISNIVVSNFYHGIAIRCSNVAIDTVSASYCGFTSIVIKSAQGKNSLTQNVTVKNVTITGDSTDVYRRGGAVLVQSYNDESKSQNITIDNVKSIWGGEAVVEVQQLAGTVQNVSISNCYGQSCGDNPTRSAYDIIGGINITFTNCNTVNSNGFGFRSAGKAVNLVVKSSSESGSAAGAWLGNYKYLQLNGVEIIK